MSLRFVLLLLCAHLCACGAKTGLEIPDAQVEAGVDATLDAGLPCVEIPFDGGPVDLDLQTEAQLARADIVFLIDTTASMRDEINRIRERLRDRLAPAIEAEIPDTQIGVATFEDFPVEPYGSDGPRPDSPFRMLLPVTDDLSQVQAAVNGIDLGNGVDDPESQVEALYQIATAEGLGSYVPASFGCPMGGAGYPCFRFDALPVVLLFTDQVFHNGPGGSRPYDTRVRPAPHSYNDAVLALNQLDIRVIGFDSGDGDPAADLRAIARDTNAVGENGAPLVFDIGRRGERLGTGVIDAMQIFADNVIFDVDARARDVDGSDDIDAADFVASIRPIGASPEDGIEGIDEESNRFLTVKAGTRLFFVLTVRNDAVVPGDEPQSFEIDVVFRGDGSTNLGTQRIRIVIPAADGTGCDM